MPSRDAILRLLSGGDGPQKLNELCAALAVEPGETTDAFERRLQAMERDGQIVRNRRGAYALTARLDLVRGRVVGHQDGFGFLVSDEGGDDVFLPARTMRSLLHDDRALVRITGVDRRGRREGALVEVLERANHEVVGRYVEESGVGYVIPDNKRIHQDILVPATARGSARDGQVVVVTITHQPDEHRQPIGRIDSVLGDHMAPGMEIEIAIRAHQIPYQWPDDVALEIRSLSPEVMETDKQGRRDLRDLPLVTIDGEDARDFDDAVHCRREGSGWRLWVAIADVSHYVRPGSALDREAYLRGNSVYFPDRAIPMLPEPLSNGLCSLNPNVDRLCMVCEMSVSARGEVKRHEFYDAVMRSAARLTYREVARMIEQQDVAIRDRHASLLPHLEALYALYDVFAKARARRGAIEFETTETRIVFDAARRIERIEPTLRHDAHRLIEECMVAANVAAATLLLERAIPALYRVHDRPSPEKLEDLRTFLGELGLSLGGGATPAPRDYAQLLASVAGRPDAHLVQTVLLRSLKLAQYAPNNLGHFGLAYPAYTHFTSPIRRYPDLLVHRAIRSLVNRPIDAAQSMNEQQDLGLIGEHCSMTERRADEATRDAITWLKCEYMQERVGEVLPGVVSAVTSFGLFVVLDDVYVEGLVHVTALPNDYYHFDPVRHRLSGERSGRVFRLASRVVVRVVRVGLDDRKIEFELVEQRT